jgi:tRNA G18 (ribose-2'-O)-methylase SpoU
MQKKTIEELQRISIEQFKTKEKLPLVVVLDNVRSLHNVGSVFRTSDAYLVQRIFLCGITATPPSAEIHKTALGAEDSVEWHYFPKTEDALQQLKNEGFVVLSVEQAKNSLSLISLQLDADKKYAIVLGNEVKGVQQQVVDMSDGCVELPQYGTKHSLNVSVTAGIVIWDFYKQMQK